MSAVQYLKVVYIPHFALTCVFFLYFALTGVFFFSFSFLLRPILFMLRPTEGSGPTV